MCPGLRSVTMSSYMLPGGTSLHLRLCSNQQKSCVRTPANPSAGHRHGRLSSGTACFPRHSSVSRRQKIQLCPASYQTQAEASPKISQDPASGQPSVEGPYASLPDMWPHLAEKYGQQIAAEDPHQTPATKLTFKELQGSITAFASGLRALGLAQGQKVALFSENSSRWLVADQAIMLCGAADAVRGASSPPHELAYIMRQSDSSGLVVQDLETLRKLLPYLTQAQASNGNGNGNGSNGSSSRPTNGHSASSNGGAQQKPLSESIGFVTVLWGQPSQRDKDALGCPVLSYAEVADKGRQNLTGFEANPVHISGSDLATLVYTSGTTGNPKGVMLTHSNLLYQLNNLSHFLQPSPGESSLSLLPPWHIYERSCGYFIYSRGVKQVYTNIRRFREDLTKFPPQFFVCVPLVIDTLQTKVKAAIKRGSNAKRTVAAFFFALSAAYIRARRVKNGVDLKWAVQPRPLAALVWALLTVAILAPLHRIAKKLVYGKIRGALGVTKCVVSGGGSLQPHLDEFYEILDLTVLNGWGLSETSPVLACRSYTAGQLAVRGSVGRPIPGTKLRVVDPDSFQDVPDGQQGVILAQGPGVMKGYYNDPQGTQRAFPESGWFNTGDLGWRAPEGVAGSNMAGVVVLTGRAKDTIVLSSGENIEPSCIEDAVVCSPLIKFCVLLGQDRRSLGALVVLDPEALEDLEKEKGQLSDAEKQSLVKAELAKVSATRPPHERIAAFEILKEPFSAENDTLTRSMKVRRPVVMQKYTAEVEALKKRLR
ncbi:hypothetical protein ABBQ38_001843 [Trebouxia sp. C0009 RCD-2024]